MIKKIFMAVMLLMLAAGALSQQPTAPKTSLKVGDQAPDFTLTDNNGNQVKLSTFKDKKTVVLAFYVLAFTGG
jgi:peroxiredoxin